MIEDANDRIEFTTNVVQEFIAKARRLCESQTSCEDCPLHLLEHSIACSTCFYDVDSINEQIKFIEKWSEKHPKINKEKLFCEN